MNETKILLTADWHIDAITAGVPRIDEIDSFVEELEQAIVRENVSHLIHLGDFFNPGNMLCSLYTQKLIDIIYDFTYLDELETIVLIAGNHDVIETSRGITTISPIDSAFSNNPKVRVFEQPSHFVLGDPYSDISKIINGLALPFVARAAYDENSLSMAIKRLHKLGNYPLIVVGHMTVPGALVGSETQDMPRGRDLDFPIYEISKLKPSLIANGHYHKYQITNTNIVIPGSPFRFTFGEKDNKRKGYTIVTITH